MILLLDNFDSFTYNLQDYLARIGVKCTIFRNDVSPEEIFSHKYNAIVLSPGPGRPEQAGCLSEVIRHYEKTHPILGICLGHQALGEHFGAQLTKAEIPMHGKISPVSHSGSLLFRGMPETIQVVRYHSLVLEKIPDCMEVIARTAKQEVMGISHKYLPIHGLQFHPEAILTENGLQMLHNWVSFYNLAD